MAIGKESEKVVSIVSKQTKAKLDEIAAMDGRSTSNYVARLIEKDIAEKEKDRS